MRTTTLVILELLLAFAIMAILAAIAFGPPIEGITL
jgi:Tfp pilus assembly protein FimT